MSRSVWNSIRWGIPLNPRASPLRGAPTCSSMTSKFTAAPPASSNAGSSWVSSPTCPSIPIPPPPGLWLIIRRSPTTPKLGNINTSGRSNSSATPCRATRGSASFRDARPSGLPTRFTAAPGPRQALAASGAASTTWLRARSRVVKDVRPASGPRSATWLSGSASSSRLTAGSRPFKRTIASRWPPWCRRARSRSRSPRTIGSDVPLPKQARSLAASTPSRTGTGVSRAAQSSSAARSGPNSAQEEGVCPKAPAGHSSAPARAARQQRWYQAVEPPPSAPRAWTHTLPGARFRKTCLIREPPRKKGEERCSPAWRGPPTVLGGATHSDGIRYGNGEFDRCWRSATAVRESEARTVRRTCLRAIHAPPVGVGRRAT